MLLAPLRRTLPVFLLFALPGAAAGQAPPFTLDLSELGNGYTVTATTVAAGLNYPYGFALAPDGSILFGESLPTTSGGIEDGPSIGSLWSLPIQPDGSFGAPQQLVNNLAGPVTDVRAIGGVTLVDSGAASGRTMTFYNPSNQLIGTLTFSYPTQIWDHSTGMSLLVPEGSNQRVYFIVGSEYDQQASTAQVTTSGLFTATLDSACVYSVDVSLSANSVTVLGPPQLIATGLRNPYGLTLDDAGNLIIGDNGQDGAHNPNEIGADTLNVVPAAQIGTTVYDFGFPNSYTLFATGQRVNGDPDATDPLVALLPIPNSLGVLQLSEGLSGMAYAAPRQFPFTGSAGGEFIGFHGTKDANDSANYDNALLYYDFASRRYTAIVDGGTNGVGHLDSVLVDGDSLFIADFSSSGIVDNSGGAGTGVIYRFAFAPQPIASLMPTSVSFGNQNLNTTSSTMTLRLSNTGNGPLVMDGINITGANASEFSAGSCPAKLAPGENCTISVTFTPSALGNRAATLVVTDNSGNVEGSTQQASLTGTGVRNPLASVTPSAIPFADQNVGSPSAAQTVTIGNKGESGLAFAGITIGGGDPTDFSQTNNCPGTLAINSSCTVFVVFQPRDSGTRSARLAITDNNDGVNGSVQSVTLTGAGLGPRAVLAPTSFSFSSQSVGSSSAAAPITLTNSGNAALTITAIGLGGADPGEYAETDNCANGSFPATLAAASSCTIRVSFTPAKAGDRTATLVVTDNSLNVAAKTQSAGLAGTGMAPEASASPASLTFGDPAVGNQSVPQTVTLWNHGNATLDIASIALGGTNAGDFSRTTTCSSTLASDTSCTVSVIFTPTAKGTAERRSVDHG